MCDKKVRDELDRILETFAIQVDNPISVSTRVYQPSTYGVNMVRLGNNNAEEIF